MEDTTTPNAGHNLTDAEFFGEQPKQYAGFWLRFVAIIIDVIVLTIVQFPLTLIMGPATMYTYTNGSFEFHTTNSGAQIVSIIIGWVYFAGMESSSMQATLGKRALSLIVTDENGMRVTFAKATGRHFAKILSWLILFIGFIMAGFTEKKQGLHDILAGTLVIIKPAGFKHS